MYEKVTFNVIEKNKYENKVNIAKHLNTIIDKLIMNEFTKEIEQYKIK